jgi:hypothetical protein
MMVDTTIYGYLFEDHIACPGCIDASIAGEGESPYSIKSGAVFYESPYGDEPQQGQGIFSHEDDGYGISCDDCYDPIFEVWPDVAHSEYGSHDEFSNAERAEADCGYCSDYLQGHEQHANDAFNAGEWTFEDWCETCAEVHRVIGHTEHQLGKHAGTPVSNCQFCQPALAKSPGQVEVW